MIATATLSRPAHPEHPVLLRKALPHVRAVERALVATGTGLPERRREQFLQRCWPALGRTQQEHVAGHCEQVSLIAVRLGVVLGVESSMLEALRLAGLFHDIGKALIPEAVLAKPQPLSLPERELVRRHAPLGAAMAARLGLDQRAVQFVRHHHTRYAPAVGGDPWRLTPPWGARILCVADALVTMLSHRPYENARSLDQALADLQRDRGGHFDPAVVDAVFADTERRAHLAA